MLIKSSQINKNVNSITSFIFSFNQYVFRSHGVILLSARWHSSLVIHLQEIKLLWIRRTFTAEETWALVKITSRIDKI
jgi:hypothetical protein